MQEASQKKAVSIFRAKEIITHKHAIIHEKNLILGVIK
jgi:hypothetical protein